MPHGSRPGDELGGRYTLVDLLSESRGGRFWRARDQVLARHVALHVIAADDDRSAGLLEAARRSAAVQDRRLLRVLDADERDGLVYVVNEWGVGSSLDILLTDRPLTPRRAAWIVSEVADAMAAAHAVDVPHGHLVPENVLVDSAGSVRVIGHAVDAALRGVGPGRAEDDVVNIAGLLYSGLTGRWAGRSYSEVDPAPTEDGAVLRPRQVRAGIPRALDHLCGDVLDAERRGLLNLNGRRDSLPPQDAADIAALLQEFVGDPLEMAAAEAARGHGAPPPVAFTDRESRSAPPRPPAHARDDEDAAGATEDDGPTRREVAPAEAAEDATREVELPGTHREPDDPTVAVPVTGDGDATGDADDADAGDADAANGDEADAGDAGDANADEADAAGVDADAADADAADAADRTGASPPDDAPTQAGVPIFRDDTDEVCWVGKEQERPPPPPPLEDPPDRPLFAPDPPEGQPRRRPRPGADHGRDHHADHHHWPWGTGGGPAVPGTAGPVVDDVPADRGPVPGRRWLRLAVLLGAASLVLLAVVFVADLLRGGQPLGVGPAPEDSPSASDVAADSAARPVTGLDVRSLDPQGDEEENDGDAALVTDGDQATTWRTSTYFQQLGPQGLKTGVGLVIDLGESTAVREVALRLVGSPTTAELYLTDDDPADVDGLEPVGEIQADGQGAAAELPGEESGRYLVLWLTGLPAVDGGFRGEIGEVVVRA